MYYIGIDIGSTAAKIVVLDEKKHIVQQWTEPTGWSSVDTARSIKKQLADCQIDVETNPCVATGYGRIAVPYAKKTITEITCHAVGACEIFREKTAMIVDIGGQDTKAIKIKDGMVCEFSMNDKCSAGTGKFLEIMANSLGIRPDELCSIASNGSGVTISSMCTVFAQSEITSLIGMGEKKENIAYAVVDSIANKVASQVGKMYQEGEKIILTGGTCECGYLKSVLEEKIGEPIFTKPEARFAGALGAAICAFGLK